MKCVFSLLLLCICVCGEVRAQLVDSLFANIPRDVLPMLDRTARLDMIDLYNSGLPAKAENVLGGQAEMVLKTADHIALRTSDVGSWQLKVLPSAHDVFVLCIRTLQRGGLSSSLSVYNRHWQVTKGDWLPQPGFDLLYKENKKLSAMRQHELRTLLRDLPVVAEWQDEGKVLVFRKDLTDLSWEDKAEAQSCLRCAAYEWKEGRFEPVDYLNER